MQTTGTYKIKGMHCASCAGIIEKTFKKTEGVTKAEVNYGTESAKLSFDSGKTGIAQLSEKIAPLGYSIIMEDESMPGMDHSKMAKESELKEMRRGVLAVIPLAVFSAFVMGWDLLASVGTVPEMQPVWKELFHHLLPPMATYALFVVGKPYLSGVLRFIRYGKANMDTLVGIGTSAAFLYSLTVTALEDTLKPYLDTGHTYYDVTIIVIAFIALGKYLEARSKMRTGDAIAKLLNLQAKNAVVVRDGAEVEVPIADVREGDLVIVKPAGRIPVDGIVTEGDSYVDEAVVTGEPMPIRKTVGDAVVSGTMNGSGAFTFRATKVGSATMLSRIIAMVEDAQGSRAPIQALADKVSAVFVPSVLVVAVVTLAAWLLFGTGPLGFSKALSSGLVSFVGVLVIACPCALGLATPTAIIVGVGKGAKEGILIKDAATLEKLHEVDTVVVDKTGTLTNGRPEVVSFTSLSSQSADELFAVLAALEQKSEHPIARAIVARADEKKLRPAKVEGFEALRGRGLKGVVSGKEYHAGNVKLIKELGIAFDAGSLATETAQGKTSVLLAAEKEVLAVCMVADAIKPEAARAVKDLRDMGIRTIMLTGDDARTAAFIGKQAGVDEVVADVLPEDKLAKITALQNEGRIVAMAGDGVNDAPALAKADVGIAMATGTDVAIETAGITLLHGDISKLVKAVRLSKLTMRGIRQNLFWAFAYNVIGIPLAAGAFYPIFGWLLNPVFAGLAMAFSSVSVVGNSLRLKSQKL